MERYVGELADWLARQGHDVTLLTTAPDRSRVEVRPSGAAVCFVRSGRPFYKRGVGLDALWRTLPSLARRGLSFGSFDIVEAHHYPDALVLQAAGALRRQPPYSLWLPGVVLREHFADRPLQGAAVERAMRGARALLALSRFAADEERRDYGLECEVMNPGIDTSLYAGPPRGGVEAPFVFCAATAEDPRKKLDVLVRAFAIVARRHRSVELVLSPPVAAPAEALLGELEPEIRARARVHVPSGSAELADLYRRASVSALLSVGEAFGLVVVESLAAGTPVVGARHGAIPEV
ncbi:MAG: glycosyltransferase family 4 protein, partial [Acidimicrobiales bacterium]